jgi:hypothetical protein
MDLGLLGKLFGRDQQWLGPCTVTLNAAVAIQTAGNDAIAGGGAKVYAPRSVSGRVAANAVCFLRDGSALLMLQQQKTRTPTGDEVVKQVLTVADPARVVAVEFESGDPLAAFGLTAPPLKVGTGTVTLTAKPK